MKIDIKATNIEITPSIRNAVEEKMNSLEKFISNLDPNVVKVFFEVSLETKHHKKGDIFYAEANVEVPGKIIRAEAREENLYTAINVVKDKLQRSLKKYKETL